MKYISNNKTENEEEKILAYEKANNEELKIYQEALKDAKKISLKSYFFVHFQNKFKKIFSSFRKILKGDYSELMYSENYQFIPFPHSEFGEEQWLKFYKKDYNDIDLFYKLIKYYGIPDIKNKFIEPDENYYLYHPDFLFFKEIETLLSFFLLNKIRKKEIAFHYDVYINNYEKIQTLEKLQINLNYLKDTLQHNYNILTDYIDEKLEIDLKNNKISDKNIKNEVLNNYDKYRDELLNQYEKEVIEYNKILSEVSLINLNDKDIFEKVIHSANLGVLMLNFGDFLTQDTLSSIDKDNLYYYFILSIIFSEDKIWNKYNITLNSLKSNISKINNKSKETIFFPEIIEELINFKNNNELKVIEDNHTFYWKNLVQKFNFEDFFLKIEVFNLKHKNEEIKK